MKKTVILLLSFVMIAQISFGQFANTPPTGNSSNLCPGVTHRYTSPVNPDGGRCDAIGGWDVTNGKIVANGLNANGSVWAEVKWDNKPTGLIGNMCGVLSVTINSIAQPEIPGNGTILLCGTSSLTISANVSSTANITGYVWDIKGTGVTPTGIVNTTAPQITINYSNWVAGSTQSASVAVGSRNSCGFSTATSPLKDIELLPGVIEKAIPRKAWHLQKGPVQDY